MARITDKALRWEKSMKDEEKLKEPLMKNTKDQKRSRTFRCQKSLNLQGGK